MDSYSITLSIIVPAIAGLIAAGIALIRSRGEGKLSRDLQDRSQLWQRITAQDALIDEMRNELHKQQTEQIALSHRFTDLQVAHNEMMARYRELMTDYLRRADVHKFAPIKGVSEETLAGLINVHR